MRHAALAGSEPAQSLAPTHRRIRFPPGWLWALLLFAIGFCLTFRMVLFHNGAYSIGENGDGIIVIATLEHWYHVVLGNSGGWRTTGFFYPARGTLGLTDTYFLYAIPYVASRALGLGLFAAFNASVFAFSMVGYWSMYALCRRMLAAAPLFAAGAATIFAFGVMPIWKLLHAQTYTVMFAPAVCLLLLAGWHARQGSRKLLLGAATGLLCGLILLSAAQTAWFLCFTFGLAGVTWLLLERPRLAPGAVRSQSPIVAGLVLGLAISSVPVLAVYLPMVSQGTRDFAEVLAYSPHVADLIYVPPGTPVWSDLLQTIGPTEYSRMPSGEMALGYTPGFLFVVVAAAVSLCLMKRRPGATRSLDHMAIACVVAALLSWALQLGYSGAHLHPWAIVFRYIPGAQAIRTPFRIQLAAQFLMCVAFAHLLTRHTTAAAAAVRAPGAGSARVRRSAAILILLGLGYGVSLMEQMGPGPLLRSNAELTTWLSAVHRPPLPCEAFYLMPDPTSSKPFWQRQSDAMLLSQWVGLPTLNGSSSWMPPGWALMHPEAPDYPANLRRWIDINNLQGKVCGVDEQTGQWFATLPS